MQLPRDDFHGYAIRDFLDVDPRFGTMGDLQALIDAAHALEIRVVLARLPVLSRRPGIRPAPA